MPHCMLWGYIAPRYLGDFVPFLVLASAVAMADIFRRLEGRRRSVRLGAIALVTALALFSIVANIGMAVTPIPSEWSNTEVVNYVEAQKSFSDLTGHPLQAEVVRGSSLPPYGPAGQIYVIGNCSGMYISTGENFATVPSQQYQRATWYPVTLGQPFAHTFHVSVNTPISGVESVSLVSAGNYTVRLSAAPTGEANRVLMTVGVYRGTSPLSTRSVVVDSGSHTVGVTTDPETHQVAASIDGIGKFATTLPIAEPIRSATRTGSQGEALTAELIPQSPPALCESLIH